MEHKNLLPENAVMTGITAKRKAELTDGQMSEVTGGYTEVNGWAEGWVVSCPGCHVDTYGSFDSWIESDERCLDGYRCRHCGTVFGIDKWGRIWGDL